MSFFLCTVLQQKRPTTRGNRGTKWLKAHRQPLGCSLLADFRILECFMTSVAEEIRLWQVWARPERRHRPALTRCRQRTASFWCRYAWLDLGKKQPYKRKSESELVCRACSSGAMTHSLLALLRAQNRIGVALAHHHFASPQNPQRTTLGIQCWISASSAAMSVQRQSPL